MLFRRRNLWSSLVYRVQCCIESRISIVKELSKVFRDDASLFGASPFANPRLESTIGKSRVRTSTSFLIHHRIGHAVKASYLDAKLHSEEKNDGDPRFLGLPVNPIPDPSIEITIDKN